MPSTWEEAAEKLLINDNSASINSDVDSCSSDYHVSTLNDIIRQIAIEPSTYSSSLYSGCNCGSPSGRKLVVAIDGTSNQFSRKNTNVIELYARIIKSDKENRQLTYYNSGIGTYANPARKWSIKYFLMWLDAKIDLAVAWNFDRIIRAAYRWLSQNYEEGDQIFLFGFSRGAYQVRALAGMIEKVGLIFPGNEEQIPFAYELYVDPDQYWRDEEGQRDNLWHTLKRLVPRRPSRDVSKEAESHDTKKNKAETFKDTFSRKDVRVHFVGAWDTVSSVGIFRKKNLPLTEESDHICFFRHALALDERRVKFMPEYIKPHQQATLPNEIPRVKEVWFAGCHSDVGGGNKPNPNLNVGDVPSLWMGNEATEAGLRLESSHVEWNWEKLRSDRPTESLTLAWHWMEYVPFTRLRTHHPLNTTIKIHRCRGRGVQPWQKVHASVAFKDFATYEPKASLRLVKGRNWQDIVKSANHEVLSWADGLEDILEMDLFDLSVFASRIDILSDPSQNEEILRRLRFVVASVRGWIDLQDLRVDELLVRMALGEPRYAGRQELATSIILYRFKDGFHSLDCGANTIHSHTEYHLEDRDMQQFCVNVGRIIINSFSQVSELYEEEISVRALGGVAHNAAVRELILQKNIVDDLSDLLGDSSLHTECCRTLSKFARHGKLHTAILRAGTHRVLQDLVLRSDDYISASASEALCSIETNENFHRAMYMAYLADLMSCLGVTHDGSRRFSLSQYDHLRNGILDRSKLDSLRRLLQAMPPPLLQMAVESLAVLLISDELEIILLESGIIELLKDRRGNWPSTRIYPDLLCMFAEYKSLRANIIDSDILPLFLVDENDDSEDGRLFTNYVLKLSLHDDIYSRLLGTPGLSGSMLRKLCLSREERRLLVAAYASNVSASDLSSATMKDNVAQ